jgi:hypothetical protein
VQGIAKLVESEGAKKPKLLDYVKKCPAKWSQQVKLETMNLPIYGWGALTELIASITGRAVPLTDGVFLAKLQHIQSVFEVCCINTTATEFNSYGWVLARNYESKVQGKMDQTGAQSHLVFRLLNLCLLRWNIHALRRRSLISQKMTRLTRLSSSFVTHIILAQPKGNVSLRLLIPAKVVRRNMSVLGAERT